MSDKNKSKVAEIYMIHYCPNCKEETNLKVLSKKKVKCTKCGKVFTKPIHYKEKMYCVYCQLYTRKLPTDKQYIVICEHCKNKIDLWEHSEYVNLTLAPKFAKKFYQNNEIICSCCGKVSKARPANKNYIFECVNCGYKFDIRLQVQGIIEFCPVCNKDVNMLPTSNPNVFVCSNCDNYIDISDEYSYCEKCGKLTSHKTIKNNYICLECYYNENLV